MEGSAQRVTDDPVKTTLVGLVAWVLFVPLFVLIAIVLAISLIGIPLLVLLPFAVVAVLVMAVVGFSGTAYAVGQWATAAIRDRDDVRVCRYLPGDPDHPSAAPARPRRGAGRLDAQPGCLPAGGDRSGRGVPRVGQRVRRRAHQYVLALAGNARRAFDAADAVSGALISSAGHAQSPSTPELVQIGQPDSAVHDVALHELFPQVLFPLLCVPLVKTFGMRHLMPDDGGKHQHVRST